MLRVGRAKEVAEVDMVSPLERIRQAYKEKRRKEKRVFILAFATRYLF